MAKDIVINYSSGEILEPKKNLTLGERFFSGGNPLPEDPTKPINPWAPKPIGPVLPNKMMAAKGGLARTGFADGPEKKYITPLRRKFDGRKFDSVPDPTYSDGRRRVKTKAYEKWLKEQHALPKPKDLYKRTVRPELDNYLIEIAEAMREADNTQDFEYLMRNKEATKKLEKQQAEARKKAGKKVYKQRVYPKGMLSLEAIKVLENLETNPANLKIIADSLGEDIDWVLQILDERNQYVWDVKGERALAKDDPKYKKPRNDYLKVENWLQKNAKRYSTPQAFEKALIKRFGNKNQFIMDMKSPKNLVTTYFSPEFKKLMLNADPASGITPSHLKQLISSSLYNYNDKIKAQLTDEIKKIFTSENLPKLRTEARKMIKNNPLFKMFGLDKTITGPFPRVIQGVIGEKLWKDFRAFRHPRVNTYELLKAFEDLVPKEFKGIFKESARAVLDAQQNKWPEAKKKLGIADKIAWDHKIPSSIIDKGYADIIEYTKVNPVNYEWNSRIKNAKFDTPLNRSIKKFEKAKTLSAKKKIVQNMISDKNKFSKNWGGYLDEIDINFNEKTGQLKFSSSAKPLDTKANTVEMLKKSISQIEKKYKPVIQSRLNSGIPLDDIFQRIAADLNLPMEQIKNVAGKALRGLGKVAVVADPMFAAMDASEAFGKGASGKDTAEYVTKRFFEGLANLPALAMGGAGWLKDKAQGKDAKFDMPYEFTFARDALKRDLDKTPENVKQRRIAEIEFDNTILPNMTMVDVMEESASKEDIEIARDTFLKERLGENYKNTHPKEGEIDIEESEVVKDKYQQWLARGGRVGFSDGSKSPNEILEAIKKEAFELENNWNTEKNWWENLADVVDVRNVPYYADRAMRGVANVAEVSAKLPFVAGELISDLIRKPGFKRVEREKSDDEMTELFMQQTGQDYRLKPTEVWGKAWDNIMPGTFSEKLGLDSLISDEELRMQEQGMSKWPQIAGSNIELGVDVTLPWGYIGAARKAKQLEKVIGKYIVPGANVDKKVNDLLTDKGMGRRDFMKMAGTLGIVGTLKALGLDKLLKGVSRNPIPGPIKMVERSTTKMPVWFPKFIDKVNEKMTYKGDGMWDFTGTDDFLPGFHIERVGDDYYISGKNEYNQDFQITYESPKWEGDADGSYYNSGEFIVEDSVPVGRNPEDVDFDGEVVEDLHDVLGGTRGMEEIAKGEKIDELTKGENAVIEAEVKAEQAYDMARDEGYFDDIE